MTVILSYLWNLFLILGCIALNVLCLLFLSSFAFIVFYIIAKIVTAIRQEKENEK